MTFSAAETDRYRKDRQRKAYEYRTGVELFRQYAAAARYMRAEGELDAREDECWRMYGIRIEYYMDERIIYAP